MKHDGTIDELLTNNPNGLSHSHLVGMDADWPHILIMPMLHLFTYDAEAGFGGIF
jgi:hypothetical protein